MEPPPNFSRRNAGAGPLTALGGTGAARLLDAGPEEPRDAEREQRHGEHREPGPGTSPPRPRSAPHLLPSSRDPPHQNVQSASHPGAQRGDAAPATGPSTVSTGRNTRPQPGPSSLAAAPRRGRSAAPPARAHPRRRPAWRSSTGRSAAARASGPRRGWSRPGAPGPPCRERRGGHRARRGMDSGEPSSNCDPRRSATERLQPKGQSTSERGGGGAHLARLGQVCRERLPAALTGEAVKRVGRREADLLLGPAGGVGAGDSGADGGRGPRVVARQPALGVPDRTFHLVLAHPRALAGPTLALEDGGPRPGLLGVRDAALGGGGQRLGVRLDSADQRRVGLGRAGRPAGAPTRVRAARCPRRGALRPEPGQGRPSAGRAAAPGCGSSHSVLSVRKASQGPGTRRRPSQRTGPFDCCGEGLVGGHGRSTAPNVVRNFQHKSEVFDKR